VTDVARARAILAALGLSADLCRAITGEVVRRQGGSWGARCTERQDLLAIAIDQVWHVLQMSPQAGGGLLRLRVRWAVREALREEAYQHGFTKADRRREQHPLPERHCRCGKSLGTRALGGVRCCPRCQLSLSAESSRRYRERKKVA